MTVKRCAILIAGPTASGKSALAIEKARETGGYIVNADSMQVYDVLNVLTARPPAGDLAQAEHFLYGHVSPASDYSVGTWSADVAALLALEDLAARVPIFVGGTGLYFRALMGGLSQMPDVPEAVRAKWRAKLAEVGPEALHPQLLVCDPIAGARIKPQDGQRIVRALEIFDASGLPISHWQSKGSLPLIDLAQSTYICLSPDRAVLDQRIALRLRKMVDQGALGEVAALAKLNLNAALPAMKAIGVPEFINYLAGKTDLETALHLAYLSTRQYVKRQSTWFRNQLGDEWRRL